MLVQTFHGASAQGNWHNLVLAGSAQLATRQGRPCISAPVAIIDVEIDLAPDIVSVTCKQHHKTIEFCGSGLAAAIFALSRRGQLPALIRHGKRRFTPYSVGNHIVGFSTRAVSWRPCRDERMWQRLVDAKVNAVRVLPGYALLELTNANAVATARPRLKALTRYSKRALIITAPGPRPGQYVMRYFAPQYGKAEDGATGSANALLLCYWAKRLQRWHFKAQQLSATGGEFTGRYQPPRVYLYGRATTHDLPIC